MTQRNLSGWHSIEIIGSEFAKETSILYFNARLLEDSSFVRFFVDLRSHDTKLSVTLPKLFSTVLDYWRPINDSTELHGKKFDAEFRSVGIINGVNTFNVIDVDRLSMINIGCGNA